MRVNVWLSEFTRPDLLILVAVTYIVGEYLRSTSLKNECIPFILTFLSICMSAAKFISITEIVSYKDVLYIVFSSVSQGVIICGMAVYVNQLFKQNDKRKR